jgi:uncharacterized membrane protein YkgB
MDTKERLEQLMNETNRRGGPLVKAGHKQRDQGSSWLVGIVLAVAAILLLANQVNSQQRERLGVGLLGFGVGLAVGRIKRTRD